VGSASAENTSVSSSAMTAMGETLSTKNELYNYQVVYFGMVIEQA
jgi:hypothetical protein